MIDTTDINDFCSFRMIVIEDARFLGPDWERETFGGALVGYRATGTHCSVQIDTVHGEYCLNHYFSIPQGALVRVDGNVITIESQPPCKEVS